MLLDSDGKIATCKTNVVCVHIVIECHINVKTRYTVCFLCKIKCNPCEITTGTMSFVAEFSLLHSIHTECVVSMQGDLFAVHQHVSNTI